MVNGQDDPYTGTLSDLFTMHVMSLEKCDVAVEVLNIVFCSFSEVN